MGTAGPIYQETVLIVLILNNPLVLKRKKVQVSGLIVGVRSQGRGDKKGSWLAAFVVGLVGRGTSIPTG